ncbi:MAG: alanine--tRNA ligase [Acidobacteriota bacterium]|nr:alanine--tRNA ligase [Acidobacteriota bacterium]
MNGNELRRKFLEYFEKHGHKVVPSGPVYPPNDPTILFTNAGMNQFKDVFLGNERREYTRAVSSQKCIRAGGKHNDLDEVGKTARHHTFFEMLGNFSFGDYFKEDAINFAWDFLTGSKDEGKLGLNPAHLWFTYFEGDAQVPADTEARDLWIKMGAQPERVLPFDAKDNFWQMGDTGPCGPCSEIHYYMGDEPDNPEKNRSEFVNAETGDETIEIWNLVFMQFNRIGSGEQIVNEKNQLVYPNYTLENLPAPSVDTGAGLERIAAVMQGVKTNYDTDLIKPIIVDCIAKLADRNYEYDTPEGFAMRVVADHARTTAFSIADGILPGNEGRAYVLRKIMRRAIYHGREHLGFHDSFFYKVCDFVVDRMKDAYPELEAQREFISKMVRLEEERFGTTMTVGLKKLEEIVKNFKEKNELKENINFLKSFLLINEPDFSIELAKLYDTFGTPKDLILVTLRDNGFEISEEMFDKTFDEAVKKLQQTSDIGKTKQKENIKPIYTAMERTSVRSTFHGYDAMQVEDTKVVALVKDDQQIETLKEGEEGLIVLSDTPFYAESGGQVGDTGTIFNSDAQIKVFDTFAPVAGIVLHKSKIEKGSIKIGDELTATVDVEKRDATRRNHTATHLVHAALREVLGTHVKQAGSVVAPQFLRFDYTHYQSLSDAEIQDIETLVNREILKNDAVNTDLMTIEEAMQTGAMALFGEKYGSQVRVLRIGEGVFSKELCGGTHVRATGDIGSFKILSDEAIASGVRRIRAITGLDAFARFREDEQLIEKSLGALRTQRDNLPSAIEKLQEELKRMRRENDDLKMKIATGAIGSASSNGDEAKDVSGVKVIAKTVEGLDKGGMRHLSDTLLAKLKSGVVVLARTEEDKVSFIVRVSDDLTDKIKAGRIVQEIAPIVGGRGGGKADMAEGGGTDASRLDDALQASYGVVEKMLS